MHDSSQGELRPTLGVFDATAAGIGAIVGGGIFLVTGMVAGLAGPAPIVSILVAAFARLYRRLLPAIGLGTCVLLLGFVSPSALRIGVVCLVMGGIY